MSEFIQIAAFDNSIDAHLLQHHLSSFDIPSFLYDEHTVSTNPLYNIAVGGIKVKVMANDFERAMFLYQEWQNIKLYDKNHSEISCPTCSSTNLMRQEKSINSISDLLFSPIQIFLSFFKLQRKNAYYCLNCKKHFTL